MIDKQGWEKPVFNIKKTLFFVSLDFLCLFFKVGYIVLFFVPTLLWTNLNINLIPTLRRMESQYQSNWLTEMTAWMSCTKIVDAVNLVADVYLSSLYMFKNWYNCWHRFFMVYVFINNIWYAYFCNFISFYKTKINMICFLCFTQWSGRDCCLVVSVTGY